MRRNLIHYWRINLAVIFGAAVATAVLTGALLVGDSVKGSLRDLTLDRLGEIDHLLLRNSFFRQNLAEDLSQDPQFSETFDQQAPFIFLRGNAVHSKKRTRASQINVVGLDHSLPALYPSAGQTQTLEWANQLRKKSGQIFPSIIINQSLRDELRAEVGDQVLLYFEKPSDIARGSLLGEKDTEEVVETLRLTLTAVAPNRALGRLGLRPHQTLPHNAYVSLPVLQKALDQAGKVNALALSETTGDETSGRTELLPGALAGVLEFEDLGLKLVDGGGSLILESEEGILSDEVVTLVEQTAVEAGVPALPSYTYLANKMESGGRLLPYSTAAALRTDAGPPFKSLQLLDGRPAPALQGNEILLNNWAARDLRVRPGDTIKMTYFGVGARDELFTTDSEFVLKGVVDMTGLGADSQLTPDYPGIADADNMADWDPPFPVDLGLIRDKDEAYWDTYRGAPKAFVSLKTGQELWGSRFGKVTSIRLGTAADAASGNTRKKFVETLLSAVTPAQFGYTFEPVKAQGLASSKGATDFSGLFFGFSMFLIVSAALLVGLLFRLGVEQRGKEVGLRLAVGFSQSNVRGQFLKEGGILAIIGSFVGLGGAIVYAWLMMVGLRTWWLAAVGSPFLFLHVAPASLVMGFFISLFVVLLSIWLGFRKLRKVPPPSLLAGVTSVAGKQKSIRRTKVVAISSIALAIAMAAYASTLEPTDAAGMFFGVGTFILISGLAFFSLWLRGMHRTLTAGHGLLTSFRMAARNTPRSPGRSMLSVALVGCACFVIVAVGANRVEFGDEVLRKDSGAGGFTLMAESDIPLNHDLSTEDGRIALGFSDDDSEMLDQSEIIPMRFLPGDDASCLNLYQVERPRILGVPKSQIERGGFQFQQLAEMEGGETANPWHLLDQELEPGVIPAFGDFNSVLWILHSGLGKDLAMVDGQGREIKLRFVGLFKKSIFQSEILIAESNFVKHFQEQNGYAYYLIQSPPEQIEAHAQILEKALTDYGFDSSPTAAKLADFQAVENTYLSTFQTLGGLGLLLGTLGLGMILIRNVIERRGDLATLRAFGFRRSTLAVLVLAENGFLLTLGIALGALSAVLAVAPHLVADASQVPWTTLVVTLAAVFIVGMLSSVVAVSAALRIPLLPALRSE